MMSIEKPEIDPFKMTQEEWDAYSDCKEQLSEFFPDDNISNMGISGKRLKPSEDE